MCSFHGQKSSSPPSDNPSERCFCEGALAIVSLYSSGLIITSLSVFFKSFFSEDQASCLVEVDEIQLDMKMKVHDGEVIEVGRDLAS